MAACVLPVLSGSGMAVTAHRRTKRTYNGEMEVVQVGPFLRKGARVLAQAASFARIALLTDDTVEGTGAGLVRRLYRQPHVAASSAPVRDRRRMDE